MCTPALLSSWRAVAQYSGDQIIVVRSYDQHPGRAPGAQQRPRQARRHAAPSLQRSPLWLRRAAASGQVGLEHEAAHAFQLPHLRYCVAPVASYE